MNITELEFLAFMLVLQHKATEEDIEILRVQFKSLDTDGSGTLTVPSFGEH
jgi:Ca2+-binding EF-hand superfamily protein